jgi:hypothetical protein
MEQTESRVWSDSGVEPAVGDEVYTGQERPIAEYDNWAMWAVTKDIDTLATILGSLEAVNAVTKFTFDTEANRIDEANLTLVDDEGWIYFELDTGRIWCVNDDGSGAAWQQLGFGADDIGSTELAIDAVGATHLKTGSVDADAIGAGAVGSSKIATGAVGSNEIDDGAITTNDLSPDAVTSSKIGDGEVGNSEIDNSGDYTLNSLNVGATFNPPIYPTSDDLPDQSEVSEPSVAWVEEEGRWYTFTEK